MTEPQDANCINLFIFIYKILYSFWILQITPHTIIFSKGSCRAPEDIIWILNPTHFILKFESWIPATLKYESHKRALKFEYLWGPVAEGLIYQYTDFRKPTHPKIVPYIQYTNFKAQRTGKLKSESWISCLFEIWILNPRPPSSRALHVPYQKNVKFSPQSESNIMNITVNLLCHDTSFHGWNLFFLFTFTPSWLSSWLSAKSSVWNVSMHIWQPEKIELFSLRSLLVLL